MHAKSSVKDLSKTYIHDVLWQGVMLRSEIEKRQYPGWADVGHRQAGLGHGSQRWTLVVAAGCRQCGLRLAQGWMGGLKLQKSSWKDRKYSTWILKKKWTLRTKFNTKRTRSHGDINTCSLSTFQSVLIMLIFPYTVSVDPINYTICHSSLIGCRQVIIIIHV